MLNTSPWKAVSPDGVYTSLVKRYFKLTIPILTRLYNEIWRVDSIPGEWFTTGRTILFHKNNKDKNDPANYRPITMLNTSYKLLYSVIDRRIIASMMTTCNWDRDQQA